MDFDAVIAEAQAAAAAQQPEPETAVTEETQQTEVLQENTEEVEAPVEEAKTETEVMFPKKALNAISRRDKTIGKLKAREQQLQSELEALKAKAPEQKATVQGEPQEADFEKYGDYLKAVARWEAKQEYSETYKKQAEESAKAKLDEWKTERIEAMEDNAAEARKAFSDFDMVTSEAFQSAKLEQHVIDAFLEADNPAFALVALAKEGLLADLNDMSPARVAMTIARYEDKGLALSKTKQQSKAPAPLRPAKGVSSGEKPLHERSVDEVMKWYQSQR
jgi:hypothetical protein